MRIVMTGKTQADIDAEQAAALEETKRRYRAKLDELVRRKRKSGFEYQGHVYQADEEMAQNITGAISAAQLGIPVFPFEVRLKDNSNVYYQDLSELAGYGAALLQFIQEGCYKPAWAAKEQLKACATEAEMQAVLDGYYQETPA